MRILHPLKRISFTLSSLMLLGAAASAAADSSPRPLDFEKINASLRTALGEFSAQSSVVENFSYQIDPKGTNIEQNRYAFAVQLKLAKTPWSSQGLAASGTLTFNADPAAQKGAGVELSVDGVYETDALALLKYKLGRATNCARASDRGGVKGILLQRHCEFVTRVQDVNSIDSLFEFLEAKTKAHRADLSAFKDQLNASIKRLQSRHTNDPVVTFLRAEAAVAQEALKAAEGVALSRTEDGGFSVAAPRYSGCPFLTYNGMNLVVSQNRVSLKGSLELPFGRKLYAAHRPVMLEVLKGLEVQDEVAMKIVKLDALAFINLMEELGSK